TASSGALTSIAGSRIAAGTAPSAIGADPSGKFIYVANVGSNNVSAYSVNPASGVLTAVLGSPFSTGVGPTGITIDPSERFAYIATSVGISANTIDTSGALASIGGSPFGGSVANVTVDPSGRFLYASGFNVNNVSGFTIDPLSGALTPITGSPFTVGV